MGVTAQRTKGDYAEQVRWLVAEGYPDAEEIRVGQDHLNTHTPGARSAAFPASEARRILHQMECPSTPNHARWLKMAAMESGVLQRCCVTPRFATREALRSQVAAFQAERNHQQARIVWQFTTLHARQKLRRLYLQI
jgi:hypothetical protein